MTGRPRKKTEEGTVTVHRVRYQNGELADEEELTETIAVPNFTTEAARLGVRGSVTHNLGNFNSVRVEIGLELPCLPELSEVDRVYDICSNFVENKIQAELHDAKLTRNPNLQSMQNNGETKTTGIRRRITG